MRRLVIHAGFGKAGSSSIQEALGTHAAELRGEGIYKFGDDLTFDHPGIPTWLIEKAADAGDVLTDRVLDVIRASTATVAVISSENLSFPHMPRLFVGIDGEIDTTIVFYFRPQFEWIPSAWKQWYMKDGTGLRDYTERCISTGEPSYLRSLQAWRTALPKAIVVARPTVETWLVGGNVVSDFFNTLRSKFPVGVFRSNESIDYSLLHVMAKHADTLFKGWHDTAFEDLLTTRLPAELKRTNAPMLDQDTANRIAQRFAEENRRTLAEFTRVENVDDFLARHFTPAAGVNAYLTMNEDEVAERGYRILLDALGPSEFARLFFKPLAKQLKAGALLADNDDRGIARQRAISA
jgi:hypothetical protein